MARVNGKQLKPTRWGMILSAFGRKQRGIIFTPEEERLALLKNNKVICPPKDQKPDPPKESRWFNWLWRKAYAR